MSGGVEVAADVDVEQSAKRQSKREEKAADLPNMTGTWNLVCELDGGGTLNTVLVLTQKGKKVKGTLENEGQFAVPIKLKIGPVAQIGGPKGAADPHKVTGKGQNPAQVSPPKTVRIEAVVFGAAFDGTFNSKQGEQLIFQGTKAP